MNQSLDRLYELLPGIYRQRDGEQGHVLQALLQIIAEQMNVVEDDIAQLYENWFIETCDPWVVPYLGELIGYQPAYAAGEPGDVTTAAGQQRNAILFPRRDVANTIGNRRRRGTVAVLARQALDVAGWPARAVEFYALLGMAQSLTHGHTLRGCTVDLRNGNALARLGGAFEETAHTVDTRRLTARSSLGRSNLPSVGLFVWRLRSYAVTMRQPFCQEGVGPQCYTFSALGNDTPLWTHATPPAPGVPIDDELQVPAPIQRRLFERRLRDCYGADKSVQIWWIPPSADSADSSARMLIPPERIIVADLSDWHYRTPRGKVALDPVLGRIAFPPHPHELPRRGIWVSYSYGFSADMGGGEYPRALAQPRAETKIYQVGEHAPFRRIAQALEQWRVDQPKRACIEITDSAVYVEPVAVELAEGQALELRAANGSAPVLRLLDWQTEQPDSLTVTGKRGSCFVLDGLLVTGRGMQVSGDLARLCIRHSTLVPGWSLEPNCDPRRPAEPSLELVDVDTHVTIEHSILGSIQVLHDEVKRDPIQVEMADSILDATSTEREAFGAPGWPFAHAVLTVQRSTVFGQVQTHAIALGENSTFNGLVRVARRQIGCMRFCYVVPGARTPRRYNCQPDMVVRPVEEQFSRGAISLAARDQARTREELRVVPEFNSMRYGTPTYCQLAATCADEIRRGADDESEMGVFHDLFQPQREANLRGRLENFAPAGVDAAIIFVN